MPLFPVSANIQELESVSRKRTHEEFVGGSIQITIEEPSDSENLREKKSIGSPNSTFNHHQQLPSVSIVAMDPAPSSSPIDLTDPGSTPPLMDSPSPNMTPLESPSLPTRSIPQPTAQGSTHPSLSPATNHAQPAKRKLTAAEREQERAEKRQKKEEEAAEKAKKKVAEEAAKAARAAEKEEKEAARLAKKAEHEAKKREREQKEAKRAEEKRKKDEEQTAARRKQEKQQNMLASFFKRAPAESSKKPVEQATMSPKSSEKPASQTETKPQESAYERAFKPFFVKHDVTLARLPFEMDTETKDAKSEILDQYTRGERGEFNPKPFNPTETFSFAFPQKRGKVLPSVKKIMEKVYGDPLENALGMVASRTESQMEKLTVNAQDRLNAIPMKYLSFYEDVRPPYRGTMTTPMTAKKLRLISRKPTGKLLQLNYDYDSEAEWVEDEDGEDLEDDEDDEESNDGDGEMEDFLDDSEDHPATVRPTFLGETEPTSTGICFEDQTLCEAMSRYRLEVLLDTHPHGSGIDPFSSSYWPNPAEKRKARTAQPPLTSMPPPNVPADTVPALISATRSVRAADAKDLVPSEVLEDFKRAIVSEELKEFTKSTITEMLAKRFSSCTKAQVKSTLDMVAHRISVPGAKKTVKVWALLSESS
ncbi:hypothetical protein F4804DRAFT_310544 [Jackrogersella minutella]|nr:hypothetical protein F4804DRAFT_310544 [Jackrogersella minutella]